MLPNKVNISAKNFLKNQPINSKNTKLNPSFLLRDIYPKLRFCKPGQVIGLPNIYIKLPYETKTHKGKPIIRQRYVPIAAIAAAFSQPAVDDISLPIPKEEAAATYKVPIC